MIPTLRGPATVDSMMAVLQGMPGEKGDEGATGMPGRMGMPGKQVKWAKSSHTQIYMYMHSFWCNSGLIDNQLNLLSRACKSGFYMQMPIYVYNTCVMIREQSTIIIVIPYIVLETICMGGKIVISACIYMYYVEVFFLCRD